MPSPRPTLRTLLLPLLHCPVPHWTSRRPTQQPARRWMERRSTAQPMLRPPPQNETSLCPTQTLISLPPLFHSPQQQHRRQKRTPRWAIRPREPTRLRHRPCSRMHQQLSQPQSPRPLLSPQLLCRGLLLPPLAPFSLPLPPTREPHHKHPRLLSPPPLPAPPCNRKSPRRLLPSRVALHPLPPLCRPHFLLRPSHSPRHCEQPSRCPLRSSHRRCPL